jgi:hypothetical protein
LLTEYRAGNDQIRFDLIFQAIAPNEIITPIRDLKLSRQEEVDYLSKTECTILGKKPNIRLTKDFGDKRRRKETLTSNQPLQVMLPFSTTKKRRRKSYYNLKRRISWSKRQN